MGRITVGVIDDHAVFRRGLLSCLVDDPLLDVTEVADATAIPPVVDVLVVSGEAAALRSMPCPTVVCFFAESHGQQLANRPDVFAVLPRRTVTPEQLTASVHAAAVGLHVNCDMSTDRILSDRGRAVLGLLAKGSDTREIAVELGYSERTIKAALSEAQTMLGTRNRTHAVAEAVRAKLI